MKTTIYKELGYDKIGPAMWSVFDISDGSPSRVGEIYPTEKELLRCLDNYAADFGCELADKASRLRNAAPDLYAALVETVADLESAYDDGQGARPTATSATIHRARAAIAKAEGND